MLIYNCIFLLCCVLLVLTYFNYSKQAVYLLMYFLVAFAIILAAFRKGLGTDYESYNEIFQTTSKISKLTFQDSIIEPGYLILNSIVKTLGGDFLIVAFFSSLLIFRNIIAALRRFTISKPLGIIVYVCLFYLSHNLNIIRQGIACSFIWLSFSYIQERNLKKFILYILGGSMFHFVAVLFIPFYWILQWKLKYPWIVIVLALSFVIGLKFDIFNGVLRIFFGGNPKFEYYTEVYFNNKIDSDYGISLGTVLNIVLLLIIYNKWFFSLQEKNLILANALFYGIISIVILNKNAVFAERIGGTLYFSLIFIIPQFIFIWKRPIELRIIGCIVILCYLSLYFYKTLNAIEYTGEFQYLPYKSIFSGS